ncbi:MAG: hypothetical protein GXX09_04650 [Syntrophomonadaceae bacterium]|nr:hypothetical protein [Syntrophomonadaceae bacterium]
MISAGLTFSTGYASYPPAHYTNANSLSAQRKLLNYARWPIPPQLNSPKRTAGNAWEKGETRLGGRIPVNISGGLKAKGHPIGATGVSQVYEVTRQLRGDMAEQGRQVEGARYGLIDTLGGDGVLVTMILSAE